MAKSKLIKVMLGFEDKFSKEFKKSIKDAGGDLNKFLSDYKKVSEKMKKISQNAMKWIKRGITAIGLGFAAALYDSNKQYNMFLEQTTKLTAVLKNTKGITEEQTKELIKYAGELQNIGVIGDTVIVAGMQQLGTFQLQADTLKLLTKGMVDVIAQRKGLTATENDAVSVGNMIGKVMAGQVGALTDAGIIFSETQKKLILNGSEMERATVLAQVLKDNVGGVNQALLDTPQGQIAHMVNQFQDLQKIIGKNLAPIIADILKSIKEKAPDIQQTILDLLDLIKPMAPMIGDIASQGIDLLVEGMKKLFKFIKNVYENWDKWKLAIGIFLGIYSAIKLTIGVFTIYNGLTNAYIVLSKSMLLQKSKNIKALILEKGAMVAKLAIDKLAILSNGLMIASTTALGGAVNFLLSPVTLVIVGLTALVAVGYLVYKNFDKVKEVLKNLFIIITGGFIGAIFLIYKNFDKVKEVIKPVWEAFKETKVFKVAYDIFEKMSNIIGAIIDKIKALKDLLSDKIGGVVNSVKSFFGGTEEVKRNALGSSYFTGGLTTINEYGRDEIIRLPSGSTIIPHDEIKNYNNQNNKSLNITINIQGNVIGENENIDNLANKIAGRIMQVGGNV